MLGLEVEWKDSGGCYPERSVRFAFGVDGFERVHHPAIDLHGFVDSIVELLCGCAVAVVQINFFELLQRHPKILQQELVRKQMPPCPWGVVGNAVRDAYLSRNTKKSVRNVTMTNDDCEHNFDGNLIQKLKVRGCVVDFL